MVRSVAIVGIALAISAIAGVGTAKWAMAETSSFYTYPVDRGPPLYARPRAVADDGWSTPAESLTPLDSGAVGYAAADSTATNVAPTYRSASGS